MNKQHWQDWTNLVLGLWVMVSPWTIAHIMATPEHPVGVTDAAMWNQYVTGIAIVALAVVALLTFAAWKEWSTIGLGAWLFVSPWLLGFSASAALMWNAVLLGVFIMCFAAWTLVEEQGPKRMAK